MSCNMTRYLFQYYNIKNKLSFNVVREQYLKTSSYLSSENKSEVHSGDTGKSEDISRKKIKKPDLKSAGANQNSTGVMILMGLGLLCMYPMVFRPMLFSEELGEIQNKEMSKAGVNLASTRPSFMPEWTSPFDASAKPSNK